MIAKLKPFAITFVVTILSVIFYRKFLAGKYGLPVA